MAGSLYLGSTKVCPAIVVKQGTPYIPLYSIVDGEIVETDYELTGHEFDGAEEINSRVIWYTGSNVRGNLVFRDLRKIFAYALSSSFTRTKISSVLFENINTIEDFSFYGTFSHCDYLKTATFKGLETAQGESFYNCFENSYLLEDIYFYSMKPTLDEYAFERLLYGTGTTTTHTVHFPSNLESFVQGLSGYPTFGGTSGYVVLAFDLPATS